MMKPTKWSKIILPLLALLVVGLGLRLGLGPPSSSPFPPSAERQASLEPPVVPHHGKEQYTLSGPKTKRVKFRATWRNVGRAAVEDLHVYVGVPSSLPEQELEALSWSPRPTGYFYDRYGQRIADFELGTLKPGEGVTVEFTVRGRFWRISYNVDSAEAGSLEEIPEEIAGLYTADGPWYRISDPLILEAARRLVGEERNPFLVALRVHDFVAEALSYELDGGWDDAATVLERGSGSCSEFTFLFIALARALGLPARYAGGSIYLPGKARGGAFVDRYNHRWAEVYIPGYGWVPFDPTWDHPQDDDPVGREYVGSHGHALVMNRGDRDRRYLGISYIDTARSPGPAELAREQETVWSDP